MADRKISDLAALTTPAAGDYLPVVDISEASTAAKNKRITIEELFRGVPLGTAAAPSIAIEGDENTGIYSPGADQLAISTGGTGRLFVDASGNIGIGTSSPGADLDVSGNIRLSAATPNIEFNNGGGMVYGPAPNTLAFATGGGPASPAERLRITSAGVLQVADAGNIQVGTTTGTKIGTSTSQKIGFFDATPVAQPTELTDELTSITHTAPGTPDYAIQDLVQNTGFGFVTKDEGNTVLAVILNLQTRLNELETRLAALGLIADAD
jgi:hypothetical protein